MHRFRDSIYPICGFQMKKLHDIGTNLSFTKGQQMQEYKDVGCTLF